MLRPGLTRDEHGFTLVELLVVILVIAILAAIALPVFLNQRARAQDTDAKTAAVTATKAMEIWQTEHDSFATATPAALRSIEPSLANARNLVVRNPTDRTYEIEVSSASAGNGGGPFHVRRGADGGIERLCDGPGRGACPGDGTW